MLNLLIDLVMFYTNLNECYFTTVIYSMLYRNMENCIYFSYDFSLMFKTSPFPLYTLVGISKAMILL